MTAIVQRTQVAHVLNFSHLFHSDHCLSFWATTAISRLVTISLRRLLLVINPNLAGFTRDNIAIELMI